MHDDLLLKFVLTTASVWLVLEIARRCGNRAAGWTAGLPITGVPTLVMMGLDRGDTCVAQAATGAMLAVVSSAVFAVVYLAVARTLRHGSWTRIACMAGALAAVGLTTCGLGVAAAAERLGSATALLLAFLAFGAASFGIRAPAEAEDVEPGAGPTPGLVALVVGVFSVALSSLTTGFGAAACGLLAGLPTTCIVVLARQHRVNGLCGVSRLLEGYVKGLGNRLAFMAAVAFTAEAGWIWAMGIGLAACIACSAIAIAIASRRAWVLRDATVIAPPGYACVSSTGRRAAIWLDHFTCRPLRRELIFASVRVRLRQTP